VIRAAGGIENPRLFHHLIGWLFFRSAFHVCEAGYFSLFVRLQKSLTVYHFFF